METDTHPRIRDAVPSAKAAELGRKGFANCIGQMVIAVDSRFVLIPVLLAACPADTTGVETSGPVETSTSGDSAPTSGGSGPTDTGGTAAPTTSTGSSADTTDASASTSTGAVEDGSTSDTGVAADTGTTDATSDTGTTTDSTAETTGAVTECTPDDAEACYGGPPETADVGACKAGERTCDESGVWGPCIGQVTPVLESCDSPVDEDCDGQDPCSGEGPNLWAESFGAQSTGQTSGHSVGIDGAGNIVLVVMGYGSVDLGGGPLESKGIYDLYLARFAPDGTHQWSERFGNNNTQFKSASIAVSPAGDIALVAGFAGGVNLGGGQLNANSSWAPLLARFDPAGKHVWSAVFPAMSPVYTGPVALDPDGNVVIAGAFNGTVDLGGGPMVNEGTLDTFLGKFDPAGAFVWGESFSTPSSHSFSGVTTDGAGDIYLAGSFSFGLDLGGGPMPANGGSDAFIARFDPQGGLVWNRPYGAPYDQRFHHVDIDSEGHVTVAGSATGLTDYGGGPIGNDKTHGVLLQIDGDGEHRWSRRFSDGSVQVYGLAVDGPGSVIVTGEFTGVNDLGGGPVVSAGKTDIFLVKYSPAGQYQWSQTFGDVEMDRGADVAASSAGAIAVTGHYTGTIDFGTGPLVGDDLFKAFLAGFGP